MANIFHIDADINLQAFRDFPVILKRHTRLFDEYLRTQIAKYTVDDRLVDLLTLLTIFHEVPHTDERLSYNVRASAFLLPDDSRHPLWMVDDAGLNIGILLFETGQRGLTNMPREKRRYFQMLSRFLVDKKRSQRFSVDGENYAWAALRYLEHISSAKWVFSSNSLFLHRR